MAIYRGATLRVVMISPSHHIDDVLNDYLLLFREGDHA
jgi:hypothetical protein